MAALVGVGTLNRSSFDTENEPLTNPEPEVSIDETSDLQYSDQNEPETRYAEDAILKQEDSKTENQYSAGTEIEKKEENSETVSSDAAIDTPAVIQSSEDAMDAPSEVQSSDAAIDVPAEDLNSGAAITQSIPTPPAVEQTPSPEKTAARAKYIMSINKNISEEDAVNLANLFEQYASEREYLDVEILMSIARLESGFKPGIDANYMGLMQVSLRYGEKAGYTHEQLLDPYYNLAYACDILDDLNKKLDGNITYILLGYNQGYYGLKSKLDQGAELNFNFAEKCYKFANEIIALY